MNIDLNNISNLDTDIVNTWSGRVFSEEKYSNAVDPMTASIIAGAAPSILKGVTDIAGATISSISNLALERAKKVCKKPVFPENPLNRGNWDIYRACMASEERKAKQELLARQKEAEAQLEALKLQNKLADAKDDKILGMPKGLAIGLGIGVGVLMIGTIILLAVRKK